MVFSGGGVLVGSSVNEPTAQETVNLEVTTTTLALIPGWNLMSLPFEPADPSINSVLPPDQPASLVMAYYSITESGLVSPANHDTSTGAWLISRRDPDTGLFVGQLELITATTGYWVYTETVAYIRLARPVLRTPTVPPSVPVKQGWNLVPVLTNQVPVPKSVTANDYFGSVVTPTGEAAWLKALRWDTVIHGWPSIGPDDPPVTVLRSPGESFTDRCGNKMTAVAPNQEVLEPLCIGEGIWLWSTIDGVLIP